MGRTSDAKDRIIHAAMQLFLAQGYNAVGVSEICTQAGVNKGSFYHYFPAKRDLVVEAINIYTQVIQDWLEQFPDRDLSGDAGSSIPATWGGVGTRLSQYLVAPIYGFAAAGTMELMRSTGAREMRRVSRADKKRCQDCALYDAQGWVPIGLLPPPGERCRCHYNCRCQVIYR